MHNTGHKKLQLSAPVPVPCCFMEYLYRVPTLPFSISSLSPLSPYSSPRSRLCTRITTTKSPTTSDSWIRARDTDPWSPNSKQPRRISAGNGVFNIGSIKLNADGIGRGGRWWTTKNDGRDRRGGEVAIPRGASYLNAWKAVAPLAAIFPLLRMVDPLLRRNSSRRIYLRPFVFRAVHWNLVVKNRGTRGIISGTSEEFGWILSSKNRADCNGIKIYSHRFYDVIGLPVVRTKGY